MTISLLRAGALSCALLATTSFQSPVYGQSLATLPPRQDTRTETGVSHYTGAFGHEARDLEIGGGGFPLGLTLDRSYLSSLDAVYGQYAGTPSQGWTNNVTSRISMSMVVWPWQQPPAGMEDWLYSVVDGAGSVGFVGGSTNPTGGNVGTYQPANLGGQALTFSGGDHVSGHFTYTDTDGSVLTFASLNQGGPNIVSRVAPDGTRLDYHRNSSSLVITSSRGYAMIFEGSVVPGVGLQFSKACVVNMAHTYVATTAAACPAGVQSVTYNYTSSSFGPQLTSVVDATGQTTTYSYNSRGHLSCITLPGQSSCAISSSYATCQRDPDLTFDPPGLMLSDPVRFQQTATGETYSFSGTMTPICQAQPESQTSTIAASSTASTTVASSSSGLPVSITDPINRTTTMTYVGNGDFGASNFLNEANLLSGITYPEGNKVLFDYDARGNPEERRARAVAGSGLPDIVTTAVFPATCTNPRTCNQPTSVTDARLNTTTFTYDSNHGGVLTETGPVVGGIQPQTRHEYAQRYAWIRNSGGSYSQVATPIWVRTATSICRNSAATGNPATPCATPGDEVRTTFEYGPNSGPNNLLLRGQVVTADGTSLRTCYGYDQNGRRISETQPNGTTALSSCP